MGDKRNFAALDWVIGEISETLDDARQALEAFVEDPKDSTRIRFCLTHIHQVHGSLQMVEFHGASLLAEEMEHLAQSLMDHKVTSEPEAQEVLMRALLQLPIYLDHVKTQKEDHPSLVLPLLNDLRAVRNQSYLSETNLFSPNLRIVKELYGTRHPITKDKSKLTQVLKKLREMYQFAAASVLRDIKVDENLNYLDKVFSRMEALTQGTACFPVWEVSAALIEGLLRGDIALSVAVRGLLRHLARELRVLGEKAPGSLDFMPRESLLKNLLYYVAKAESGGKKVNRVKQRYILSEALLDGVSIGEEGEGDSLSAPDPEAIRSVVVALSDEINSIKHVLDLSLSGHGSPEDIKEILPIVKRVADTLAVLGIGDLRKKVNIQAEILEEISQQNSFDEAVILDVAGKIIEIEHRLEAIAKVVGTNRDLANVNEREIEIDQAKITVLKECQHGLEQAKDAIVEYISSKWDKSHLLNVGSLLHNIRGGLEMIPLSRPAAILESCSQYIKERLLNSDENPGWEQLDTLADAIASLEYYLERLLGDMDEEIETLLDVAANSVAQLGYPVSGSGILDEPVEETGSSKPSSFASNTVGDSVVVETAIEASAPTVEVSDVQPQIEQEQPVSTVAEPPISPPEAVVSLDKISLDEEADSDIDDEIIEIFIEEAGEVKDTLDEYFPLWKANHQDQDALVVVRRAFHTLKGSGRMVEAHDIGELAWSIENILNRVIEKAVRNEAAHGHIIELVINVLPELINAFAHKKPNPHKALTEQYRVWATAMAEGNVPAELSSIPEGGDVPLPDLSNKVQQAPVENSVVDEEDSTAATLRDVEALSIDDDDDNLVLWEIFSSEAATHLATMEAFIGKMEAEAPIYSPPSDDFQRALHTLKGSAKMAQVTPIAAMAEPLESFAKELITYQEDINADILQLYRDAVSYTRIALGQIESHESVDIPRLQQFVARTAELRELAVGHLIRLKEMQKDGQQTVDPRLLSIFMAEEMDLLLDAEQLLGDWQASGSSNGHIDLVVRELTTLEAGAHQANLSDMAGVSAQLRTLYEQYKQGQLEANDDFFGIMGAGHNALLDMVDAVAAGQNVVPPSEEITSALASLIHTGSMAPIRHASNDALDESEQRSTAEDHSDDEIVSDDNLPLETEKIVDDTSFDIIPESTEQDIEHSVDLVLDDIDTNVEDDADIITEEISLDNVENDELGDTTDAVEQKGFDQEPVADVPEAEIPAPNQTVDADINAASEALTLITSAHIPGLLDSIDTTHEDFDEDILEVFLEEAEELIEELDEAVHAWESDWSNVESPEQIKRVLHTLKGGARLSGMNNLGELTHDYETFLISSDLNDIDDVFFPKMHAFQDQVLSGVRAIQQFMSGDFNRVVVAGVGVETEGSLQNDEIPDTENLSNNAISESVDVEPKEAEAAPIARPQTEDSNVVPFAPKPREASEEPSGFKMPSAQTGGGQAALRKPPGPQEVVKVNSDLLEELVNLAGETSISRARIEQQVSDFGHSLDDIDSTIARLQEQLRRLDIETEAQVLFRQEQLAAHEEFDPLEMDRYSQLQQLSRSLIESASDLVDLRMTLTDNIRDTETLLLQQSRINTTLQEGLMRSRMVPFSRLVPRLRRIVRQVAGELGKNVSFELDNIEGELDRSVLERMVPPLEHMLRNAVDHGIEMPDKRLETGKNETGRIVLTLGREGGDVLLRLADDGRGVDLRRVREKAIERGLMANDSELSDFDIMQFILHAGFSTAEQVTQISGRGVGMDVVSSEIKAMGGSVVINSEWGRGTEIVVRLPFTVSVNRALMVEIGLDHYAVPLNTIEGIVRVSPFELEHYYSSEDARFEYAGENYQVRYLGAMLNADVTPKLEGQALPLPVLLVRSAENTMAVQVDNLMGSREVVVKSLGSQFSAVQGLSGATLMGDGSVVVILDPHALVRKEMAKASIIELETAPSVALIDAPEYVTKTVMVVDDSVTVRKVTTRFLEREGFNVITAKDGVDALRVLQDVTPDLMLLDIEMPRMDGFEVAKNIRTSSRWKGIPIIMITSRTGDKHRDRAMELGVNGYMGKPYQEESLLAGINDLLALEKKT